METFKKIGNYIIQAIPQFYGKINKKGAFGLDWEGVVYADFLSVDFVDKSVNSVTTDMSFNTPDEAIKYAENHFEELKKKLQSSHISPKDTHVELISDFSKKLEKNNGETEIITIDEYRDGDFYTDDNDYTAYAIYGDKVFTLFSFSKYDTEDLEAYDDIKDNDLTMMELAAKALGCKVEEITKVLFVDYPECK